MNNATPLFVAACFLTACAPYDNKPTYLLASNQLHRYAPGDSLVYRIDGNRLSGEDSQQIVGEATSGWENAPNLPLKDPNGVTMPIGLHELNNANISSQTSLSQPRFISQAEDNSYSVIAWPSTGDKLLWVSADNQATFSVNVLPGTLGTAGIRTSSYDIYDCIDTTCVNVGHISESIELETKETVTTAYAKFEAYRYRYSRTATSQNADVFNPGPHTVFEKRWIYPSLGTVKYEYLDSEGTQFSASLARTSIKINNPS